MSVTPEHAAQQMLDDLTRFGWLDQDMAAMNINIAFGGEFTYYNDNFNLAIDKKVLAAFRKLTGDSVVWERGKRRWRFRTKFDKPGRQQD